MKKLWFLSLVVAAWLLMAPKPAQADVNNFVINNFDTHYNLANGDNQGSLRVTEDITVTFSDNNHGILRAIPGEYKGNNLQLNIYNVSSTSGAPTQFTTYDDNGNTVIKIGDPNTTVTGEQHYRIEYSLRNVVSFYDDQDEFYWDVNGDQWDQPIEKVSATLTLSNVVTANQDNFFNGQLACFTGAYGAQEHNCTIAQKDKTETNGFETVLSSASDLMPNETLTIVVGIKKGLFKPESIRDKLLDFLPIILKIFVLPILVLILAYWRWYKKGRDPKGKGTIVPEYEPPFKLKPAEVGVLADFKADQKDVTATIIDLAIRRYIKIIEEKKIKKLAKDSLEYSLELKNSDFSDLLDYEIEIINGIFGVDAFENKGKVVELKSLKNKFYTSVKKAQELLVDRALKGGYFTTNPLKAGKILWSGAILLFLGVYFIGGYLGAPIVTGVVISAIILGVFSRIMPARTAMGVEAKDKAKGLKLYIETAEEDRIKMMQSPDAPYNRSAEPKKTVELFEKLLPFAIVFGVEMQWADEFKDIYKGSPDWYSGNYHTFNSLYLASALSGSMGTAMNSAFASPSSSGSSGFGGGGFSGGGGGGGGGGGW